MELRDIEYFAVVAEHGNVGRASEALGLSPPALSKSLRRLEKSLQVKLVKRTPKGVELTSVGTALLAQVSRLRLALDDVAREAADLSQGRAGHLRIGAGPSIVEHLLPAAYTALLKDAPNLTLEISVTDNDVMAPALRNGELDLIFNVIPPSPYEGLVQKHLFDDEWVVCASTHHPLAKRKRVTLTDLAQERWVLPLPNNLSREFLMQQWLSRAFQDRGLPPPRVAVATRSVRLRLQTSAFSNLLSFTSRRILRQAGPRFRLAEVPVKELRWRRPVGVIYREGGYLSPAARRLIEILKSTAQEISKDA